MPTAAEVLEQAGQQIDGPVTEEALVLSLKKFITLEDIEQLEGFMLELEQTEVPVTHTFADGMVSKQITLPKGNFAIGHAHKKDCINIVLSGSASVLIDGEIKRITGPCTFVGKALDRKVGYIHEDCTWITVHATRETDLEKLDAELLIKSETFKNHERALLDRKDYQLALQEIGIEEAEVQAITLNLEDQIAFGSESEGRVVLAPSRLQGTGLFALRPYLAGEPIVPARLGDKRTPAGRFTNHSKTPNAEMRQSSVLNMIVLSAIRSIALNDEITVDYRKARQAAIKADNLAAI